jgi:hypothetical protein
MSNNNVTTGGILIAIILGIGIAKWLFAETLTTYWIYTASLYPAARETYSVDRASRTVNVLEQWPGNFVKGHNECVIFDAKNWSCPDVELWAQDGKVREAILSGDPQVREVLWWRWWLARLTHWGHAPEEDKAH